MMHLLMLVVGLTLAKGQTFYEPSCESCLDPSTCKNVSLDPTGLDPEQSPYYAIMSSSVMGEDAYDGSCFTYFALGDNVYLVLQSVVYKNGTYSITRSIRGDISGSPGAYRLEVKDPTLECESCVANDFTINALQGECEGSYLIYRCPIYGDCVSVYSGQDIVYLLQSGMYISSVPFSCGSTAESLVQQQGLSPLTSLPNNQPRHCVTCINGMTAINADCVSPENSIVIRSCSCSH